VKSAFGIVVLKTRAKETSIKIGHFQATALEGVAAGLDNNAVHSYNEIVALNVRWLSIDCHYVNQGSIPTRARNFSFLHSVHTSFGVQVKIGPCLRS
jgi:hypothetical protein